MHHVCVFDSDHVTRHTTVQVVGFMCYMPSIVQAVFFPHFKKYEHWTPDFVQDFMWCICGFMRLLSCSEQQQQDWLIPYSRGEGVHFPARLSLATDGRQCCCSASATQIATVSYSGPSPSSALPCSVSWPLSHEWSRLFRVLVLFELNYISSTACCSRLIA